MAKTMAMWQMQRLLPAVRALGFDGPPRQITCEGRPFRVEVWNTNPEAAMIKPPQVQIYETDAYPCTSKKEAVLLFWNWIGMDSQKACQQIAAELNARGIKARATKHKKNHVVAFDPGDWIHAELEQTHG